MSASLRSKAVGVAIGVVVAFQLPTAAQNPPGRKPAAQPYTWKSVQMVGGGFVDGIIFHPTAKGVRYARTDMGGAYRWDDQSRRWEPLLDWEPYEDLNLMGVESIAVDPSDANRLYLACGWGRRVSPSIHPMPIACIWHAACTPIRARRMGPSCVPPIAATLSSEPTCHSSSAVTRTGAAMANAWRWIPTMATSFISARARPVCGRAPTGR